MCQARRFYSKYVFNYQSGAMFADRRGESDCMGNVCLAEWGDEGSWDAGRLGEGEVWM